MGRVKVRVVEDRPVVAAHLILEVLSVAGPLHRHGHAYERLVGSQLEGGFGDDSKRAVAAHHPVEQLRLSRGEASRSSPVSSMTRRLRTDRISGPKPT